MQNLSAADLARQSEGPAVTTPRALTRLDRRRFLRSGALTVADIAALSGVEPVRPPLALAQNLPPGPSPVANLALLSARSEPAAGQPNFPLRTCRHLYRFDYHLDPNSTSIPSDLVMTYRLNAGSAYPSAIPGGSPADRLQATVQIAPFQDPAAAPANPFPALPNLPPINGNAFLAEQFLPLFCYRLVQIIDQQTFPVMRVARVYDWCSLYCFPGNFIVITVGDQCLCYAVGAADQPSPPLSGPKNVVAASPQLVDYWGVIHSGEPHSVGGTYYYTYSSQQGAFSTATWTANLDVPLGTRCNVEAFIPGSSFPQNRTAQARYQIGYWGVDRNLAVATVNQQLPTSQWVTLGTFPFRPGTFQVRLTDETGEPNATRVVVANAIRWVSA
jgi:hypothetical protein